jgi:signal transduction histidine kinase
MNVERRRGLETSVAWMIVAVVPVLVLILVTAVAWSQMRGAQRTLTERVTDLADGSTAAMHDAQLAAETVRRLAALPVLSSVSLYDASGRLREQSRRSPASPPVSFIQPEVVCRSMTGISGERLTLCLESNPAVLLPELRRLGAIAIGIVILSLLSSVAIAQIAARRIRKRLSEVTSVVAQAGRDRNYAARVPESKGEMGELASGLNDLLGQMQERDLQLRRRSNELESANRDLEAFVYSVSHDLRAPLGSVSGFAQALDDGFAGALPAEAAEYVGWIRRAASQMQELIEGLLQMARLSRSELRRDRVDLSAVAASIAHDLEVRDPSRVVAFTIRPAVVVQGDERLLRAVLENLLSNAWKFTRKQAQAAIEFGITQKDGRQAFFVRDNGAGFDPTQASKIFRPFQRLHSAKEFEGTGIGLATVQKIIQRHGGSVWAEGEPGKGASIYFTMESDGAI